MLMANSHTEANSQDLYWGVISYVPADIAWCEWLYFTLNGYPVPVALAARATRDGFGLPETLSVFPDPDDRDYAGRYPDALKAGRYLIVICSPNSARSESVDAHIRDFKAAGGEERIIVLAVEGEPTSGAGRRSPGPSAWLPPWLRWRLDEKGGFRIADRTEPQIIDARPGRMDLDDIMASLIAALLDVPRGEFDIASGPIPQPPPARDDTQLLDQEGMVEQIWAELNSPKPDTVKIPRVILDEPPAPVEVAAVVSPPPVVAKSRPFHTVAGILVIAVISFALGAAVWWFMAPEMERRGGHGRAVAAIPQSPKPDEPEPIAEKPITKPEVTPLPPPPFQAHVTQAPAVSVAPAPQPAPETATPPAPVAVAPKPSEAPAEVVDSGPPALTPEQISEQAAAAVLKDATDARSQADRLVRVGQVQEALPLYLKALDCTERYAALRSSDPGAEVETAKLCLVVGSLQASYASTAEARQTFDMGRRVLGKIKPAKGAGDERSRLLASLQLQIHRLDEDAPRRRAERD